MSHPWRTLSWSTQGVKSKKDKYSMGNMFFCNMYRCLRLHIWIECVGPWIFFLIPFEPNKPRDTVFLGDLEKAVEYSLTRWFKSNVNHIRHIKCKLRWIEYVWYEYTSGRWQCNQFWTSRNWRLWFITLRLQFLSNSTTSPIVDCRIFFCEGSTKLSARNKRTNQKVSGVLERLASE